MFPTALIYSSHDRSEYIHREWIIERALKNPTNKTILYLPMSMGEMHQQEYSWSTFRWYLDHFKQWGLVAHPFFWRNELRKEDVDLLFENLTNYEVVILGGGDTLLGTERYRKLGELYYGDRDLFEKVLKVRQQEGKLTVGFSAGADQLCTLLTSGVVAGVPDPRGFGLVRDVLTTLHHEWGAEGEILYLAQQFPQAMVFGLPNDSGLAVDQGRLPSGNFWQVIAFVVDCSWENPSDSWHIKTRQGMNIDHFYCDGRKFTFYGGDKMVRIISPDSNYRRSWILHRGEFLDYWTQSPGEFHNIEHVLSSH